ncbi:MAG: copper chaperone PCu(A)C [Bacteroidota bacterium]
MNHPVALFLVCLFLAGILGCQPDAQTPSAEQPTDDGADSLVLSDPFAPAAPETGTSAVFVTIQGASEPDTLVQAEFAGAERIELHETFDAGNGLSGMREIEGGIPVAAVDGVVLKPGGYHIMLIGLTEALAAGDTLAINLGFARSGEQLLRVPILSLEDMPARRQAE